MTEKKSLKEWWNEKSKNQKYLIIGAGVVLLMIMGNMNKGGSSSESNNDTYTSNTPAEYCSYCGNEITGSGTEQFGKKYCDLRCYADAN